MTAPRDISLASSMKASVVSRLDDLVASATHRADAAVREASAKTHVGDISTLTRSQARRVLGQQPRTLTHLDEEAERATQALKAAEIAARTSIPRE